LPEELFARKRGVRKGFAPGFRGAFPVSQGEFQMREPFEIMKTLLFILIVVLIVSTVRSKPDVVRKVMPTPVPFAEPHVSRLQESRLQPASKLGEKKIVW
jgi:hypothetical protein